MNISAINAISNTVKNINFGAKKNTGPDFIVNIYKEDSDSFIRKTTIYESYYNNGDIKNKTVFKDDGTVEKTDYYKGGNIKQTTIEMPSGYSKITKYYPNQEVKEKSVISAGKYCRETIEYNKDGSVKKAYRKWSNGITTKLPKDYVLIS